MYRLSVIGEFDSISSTTSYVAKLQKGNATLSNIVEGDLGELIVDILGALDVHATEHIRLHLDGEIDKTPRDVITRMIELYNLKFEQKAKTN